MGRTAWTASAGKSPSSVQSRRTPGLSTTWSSTERARKKTEILTRGGRGSWSTSSSLLSKENSTLSKSVRKTTLLPKLQTCPTCTKFLNGVEKMKLHTHDDTVFLKLLKFSSTTSS